MIHDPSIRHLDRGSDTVPTTLTVSIPDRRTHGHDKQRLRHRSPMEQSIYALPLSTNPLAGGESPAKAMEWNPVVTSSTFRIGGSTATNPGERVSQLDGLTLSLSSYCSAGRRGTTLENTGGVRKKQSICIPRGPCGDSAARPEASL